MNRTGSFLRRHAFLLAAYGIWAAAALTFFLLILRETGGHLIYNLDDAYIHLATAKHISQNGVWGVTPYGFSSSSSSILWPLLLAAAFRIFGNREFFPLLYNLVFSAVLIAVLYREWTVREGRPAWAFGMLAVWMLVFPLWPILFNGMETTLQALTAVAFCAFAVRFLSEAEPRGLLWLCLLASLSAAARYEGCFIAAAVCLLLAVRRRWKAAVWVGFSAALPVALFGWCSLGQGWSFLPNSLLIKHSSVSLTDPLSLWNMGARPFQPVIDMEVPRLPVWQALAVVLLVLLLLRSRSGAGFGFWDDRTLPAVLFLLAAVMHSMWVGTEMFFRYQAYLNALGLWAIGRLGPPAMDAQALRRNPASAAAALCAAVFLAVPIGSLAFSALWKTPVASRNIWQQQYQMGSFLHEYYPQGIVAANDIGAIDYLADIHLVDLIGLADREVMRARLAGEWSRDMAGALDSVTHEHGAQIAVIYDTWFNYNPVTGTAEIPAGWVRVADWTIPGNVVCGDATVTWYAVRPEEAAALRSALEKFADTLPAGVIVRYSKIP
jgi:hypothetical protein